MRIERTTAIPDVESQKATRAEGPGGRFTDFIQAVEAQQQEAARESEAVANGVGNLHEAALALEKADIGMRLMVRARNKLVDAYHEIMRMQV